MAARVAHNHEVAGSSPAPATKKKALHWWGFFLGFVAGLYERSIVVYIFKGPKLLNNIVIVLRNGPRNYFSN